MAKPRPCFAVVLGQARPCERTSPYVCSARPGTGTFAERCRSGRSGRSRKPLCVQAHRGFESHPLRQSLGFQLISALVERCEKTLSRQCFAAEAPLAGCRSGWPRQCLAPAGRAGPQGAVIFVVVSMRFLSCIRRRVAVGGVATFKSATQSLSPASPRRIEGRQIVTSPRISAA